MSDDPSTDLTATVSPPPPLPPGWDVPSAVKLARDLTIQLFDRETILRRHEITEEQCKALEDNDYFKKLLEQMAIEWNLPRTAQERLALQTAIGLEVVLPDAIARVSNNREDLADVAQMVKVLAEISGANAAARTKNPSAGERIVINIDLGGDIERHEKTVHPVVDLDADQPAIPEPRASPIRPVTEGVGNLLTIRTEPEPA